MEKVEHDSWFHHYEVAEVFNKLNSNENGLSLEEADHRLSLYGSNDLGEFRKDSVLKLLLRQFNNVLIYVLIISGVATALLGYWLDSSVIFGVVFINALFGFFQEGKAEKSLEAIREMLSPNANVIRAGKHLVVAAKNLVVGDVVLVKSGDKIPADLRLSNTKNLQVQESILTGESSAVEKSTEAVAEKSSIGDRTCMAYSGTSVVYGKGVGIVVATGLDAEIGKLGALIRNIQTLTTPLLERMNIFGRQLTIVILLISIVTFLIGFYIRDYSLEQTFLSAVGFAVAAIPEGLPPLLTIILAVGVNNMAKRNAIIRRLLAVETMGAVTTICTDKTGTLTRNEQLVKIAVVDRSICELNDDELIIKSGSDQKPLDDLKNHQVLSKAIQVGVLCNDASFSKESNGLWQTFGNAIDKALLELGVKFKFDLKLLNQNCPKSDLIPYESEHKLMATLHHTHDEQGFICLKGAPEQVILRCANELTLQGPISLDEQYWSGKVGSFAKQGYRVIALAYKECPADKLTLSFEDIKNNLTLIGIFALLDAPRPEAAQAVKECFAAGIKVKMITGDHADTAATVAEQVGIDSTAGVLIGEDIDRLSDQELAGVVKRINIYARTLPHHKLRLVEALQDNGELVAMTGDGANDAPALRKANIGIAMGNKGAEITKEPADLVLADDNFATIVNAIEAGRVVYDNLKKVIVHVLPTSAAQALVVVLAIAFGWTLPITPIQILWVNMVTSVTLAAALGFEPAEDNIMARPPRPTKERMLSSGLIWQMVMVMFLLICSVFTTFIVVRYGMDLAIARTAAVNMLVIGETIYLFNCRKIHGSIFKYRYLFDNSKVVYSVGITILFQLAFTYLPAMQKIFGSAAIDIAQWGWVLLLSVAIFVLVELRKILSIKMTHDNL